MDIYINGEIVDTINDKYTPEDFCPQDMRDKIDGIEEGEQIDLHITSPGGSVFAGNAIISMLANCKKNGHKIVSYVHGLAASMASAIAFSADELHVDENAVIMVHLPWSAVQGNYNDMRKEAQTLELLTKTLVTIYKTKFPNMSEEDILSMLSDETWILGNEAEAYGLNCFVEKTEEEAMRFSAKMSKYNWKHPRGFCMENNTQIEDAEIEKEIKEVEAALNSAHSEDEEEKKQETQEEETQEEKQEEETSTEETKEEEEEKEEEEDTKALIAQLQSRIEELENMLNAKEDAVSKEECEKRVSGMQASMQKQVNDFKGQLKLKDEELTTVKAEVISLTTKLDESEKELSKLASALDEKKAALEMLNSKVNSPADMLPTMEQGLKACKTPEEKVKFLKSGKYVR